MGSTMIMVLSILISLGTFIGILYKPFKKLNKIVMQEVEYKNAQEQKFNKLAQSIEDNHKQLTDSLQKDYLKIHEKVNGLSDDMKENRLAVLRVELNQLMYSDSDNIDTIVNLFEEYKGLGGNKYMDMKFNKWKKEHGYE